MGRRWCPKRRIAVVEGLIALGHSGRSACRVVGVNRSNFLRQRRQLLSTRSIHRIVVADEISRIHVQSRGTYGQRRIEAALLAECEMIVNHKLVASVMSERGCSACPHANVAVTRCSE
ncbi:IS3 family transposase [Nocardia gipuzkoensis]|uniref:IS3 family transposase n=1 Tax=Nocardia gipuzkoensis TaxID=2749991 RepID=UPI0034DD10B4